MTKKIHLIAACGTGMGTLACILKEMGYEVTGSDQNVYPPMSDFLVEKGIVLNKGFNPDHLNHDPDLVIVGNAVTKHNVEAKAAIDREIPYLSMPQAVNRFLAKDKKIILVTGTHGKTTTSSIMAHILFTAGLDPSFMIGGILKDYNSSFRIGSGKYMVIEGDEYDTAFFDKGPKFLHYDPKITIITGIEFDHADIFSGVDQIKNIFSEFIMKNKSQSHFITYDNSEHLNDVLSQLDISVESYGKNARWGFKNHHQENDLTTYTVDGPDLNLHVLTPMVGEHNLFNTLACICAAKRIGISNKDILNALKSFSGIKRRQEIRGIKNGITVMDDFAHHPTAVKETINAVKPFYKKGRVIAVFEPRTNTSMRNYFQGIYPKSFSHADIVCVCKPDVKKEIPDHEKFSIKKLVQDLDKNGIEAYHFEQSDNVIEFIIAKAKPGDLILIMSNGGFNNIHTKLLEKM